MVGRTVAHYEVLVRLGGGGMGVVYKARDVRLGRFVALKFLPPQWSHDEDAKERFIREAQAASATDHRNICTIHDVATADDGQLFIVMAYYEGQTLKQRLEAGPIPIDEALDIATQIADGLTRAHEQGVVHRDVKPGNLILAEDGVRILDFGLATFVEAAQITVAGSTLGTAAYMSPEQVRAEATDARTDVWAVGVILYQMLTGHVPFRGAYAEAIGHAIRNETPTAVRAERSEVPEEVEHLVFRAMHKDAGVRFANGRELAKALRQVRGMTLPLDLRTGVVDVPPIQPSRHRRARWPWALPAGATVLALVAGGAWMLSRGDRVPVVVVPIANQTGFAELEPYRPALTYALIQQLTDSRVVRPVSWSRSLQTLRRYLAGQADLSSKDVIQALAAETGVKVLIVPTLVYEGNQWRVRVEVHDADRGTNRVAVVSEPVVSVLAPPTAYELMTVAAQQTEEEFGGPWWRRWLIRREVTPPIRGVEGARALERGVSAYEEQEYADAFTAFTQAASLDPASALAQAWRSRVATLQRRDGEAATAAVDASRLLTASTPEVERLFVDAVVAEARREMGPAQARYRALAERFPDDVTWSLELASFEERQAGKREEWTAAAEAFLRVQETDPGMVRPQVTLCRLYNSLQEPRKAIAAGHRSLEMATAVAWRGAQGQARFCLVDALRAGSAEERSTLDGHADEAIKIFEGLGFRYNLSRALYYKGLAAGEQGRLVDAIASWGKALDEAEATGNIGLQPLVLSNLGVAHNRLGNGEQAADYQTRSAAIYARLGDQARAARQTLNSATLRIVYGEDVDAAMRDVQNALAVVQQIGDPDFEANCRETLAIRYRHLGRYEDASRELSRALNIARQQGLALQATNATIEIARVDFERSEYERARQLLEPLVDEAPRAARLRALILLGRVYTRVGDFDRAASTLARARAGLTANDRGTQLALFEALGTLADEAGRVNEARQYYQQAMSGDVDRFVDQASVEARANMGYLEVKRGFERQGLAMIERSRVQARRMGRVMLETRAAILLARVHMDKGRRPEALAALQPLSGDAGGLVVGETQASLLFWTSRALSDPVAAADSRRRARDVLRRISEALPSDFRSQFAAREGVGAILNNQ